MNPPDFSPSADRFSAAVDSFRQTVEGLKAQKVQAGADAEQANARRAEIEPQLSLIKEQAAEARNSLQQLVEQSDIFKDVKFSNFWNKDLWETKQRAIKKRKELARQVKAMQDMLAAHGVEDNHETMQALKDLGNDTMPNIAERGVINAGDFAFRHPWMAALVGVGAFLANNALKPKDPANDSWWKRLLRWSGIGLVATIFVNSYMERDRRTTARKQAEAEQMQEKQQEQYDQYQEQQQLFQSPSAESFAYNVEGAVPRGVVARHPGGVMHFNYPYAPLPPYGPMPMPYPRAPYPVQPRGMYYNPDVTFNQNIPTFYPQSRSPYPSGGQIA